MARNSKYKRSHCSSSGHSVLSLSLWLRFFHFCVLQSHLNQTEAFTSVKASSSRSNLECKGTAENSVDSATFSTKSLLGREEAQSVINDILMPQDLYGDRIGLGRDAQGIRAGTKMDANDPRLSMTYAEFPLTSLDQLMDLALQYMKSSASNAGADDDDDDVDDETSKLETTMPFACMDIGSGCGRIALYLAMTREGNPDGTKSSSSKAWNVHGIEISDLLHQEALGYCQKAVDNDLISPSFASEEMNTLSLHLGPAENFGSLLRETDCIFAYSTAFTAKVFSPELGALILGPDWSQLLGESCKDGCMAITTDRALDPAYGWQLVDRLDVENREVFGTTGYVHILKKKV
ncbi:MAG: hypothetical protein SGBAC_007682 [Bacillariaceae sp.]